MEYEDREPGNPDEVGPDADTPGLVDLASREEPPDSPLEALAAQRRVLAETKEVNIPIPGYDREPPRLLIRYHLLEGSEIDRIGSKIRRETRNNWARQMFAAVDTFIAAITGFYYDNGDGLYQELTYQGEHLKRFDDDLAHALGFRDELPENTTARQVCFALFNNNDAQIAQHMYLLNAWFTDTSLDVEKELLGNS